MMNGGDSKGGNSSAMDAVGINMMLNIADRVAGK
jgi:hypothetical protein